MGVRELLTRLFAAEHPFRRGFAVVVFCLCAAGLLTDFRADVGGGLVEGEVASDDILAPFAFPFVDESASAERRAAAGLAVAPVFDADPDLGARLRERVAQAFDMARRRAVAAAALPRGVRRDPRTVAESRTELLRDFTASLDVTLSPDVLAVLADDGFSAEAEAMVDESLSVGLERYVLRDPTALPLAGKSITVVSGFEGRREEGALTDLSQVRSPEEARQAVSLFVLERYAGSPNAAVVQAAASVARALVRPNLSYNAIVTDQRREEATAAVESVRGEVRRGARIVRAGDVIDRRQAGMLVTLREADRHAAASWRFGLWLAYVATVALAPVAFARGTIRKFARKQAEFEAMGLVLLFVLLAGRLAVSSAQLMRLPGHDDASTIGLLVPVAGGAMLVRILVNSESALVFAVVASLLSGALMDQSALYASWYLVTALVAASAVGQARERLNVLRAGLLSGVVGAGLVLILMLVRMQSPADASTGMDWTSAAGQALAAVGSGLVSAMLTLGLVPVMELFGFLTDYKLFELANLNHPLLRRLMLQAPGTYHHSVIVGSLSEAACEATGANALLARVACYFHDIGKGVKPQYFVENQRDGNNRHDRLSPEQSAQVIINHVREGGALARQHKLPKPIYDNIFMHHGTGIILYFHNRAKEQADGQPVEEALFRYPGPKPNTREAGIIMLADKVEAACRTIKEPSEERMRAMIQAIVNQVMADGQLEECPLTVRELYQISDAFVAVLLGIYHHRIEYPATKAISSGGGKVPAVPRQGTITLEIMNPLRPPRLGSDSASVEDYEAVDVPPRERNFPDVDDA